LVVAITAPLDDSLWLNHFGEMPAADSKNAEQNVASGARREMTLAPSPES
jgi:hypothetical protein